MQTFAQQHFETILVSLLLLVVAALFRWIPDKEAFLNFFYLPALAAGYLLGARRAVLTSVLCALMVVTYYLWSWTGEAIASGQETAGLLSMFAQHSHIVLFVSVWAGFLILAAGAVGLVNDKILSTHHRIQELNTALELQAGELREMNEALQTSSTELSLRATALQEVNQALEASKKEMELQAGEMQNKNLLIERLRHDAEKALYSAIDPTVARMMTQKRLRQEKRTISTLFCDLKNFTSFSHDNPPEVVLHELNNLYELMESTIETCHGHVDKHLGDGLMCEFGAPIDYERHSLQAVTAALKMQERFQELKNRWSLRIGISTGEAIVGLIGSRRRSYSALGNVVNVAKRLEELCAPGYVYIDETTSRAVEPFVEVEPVRSLPRMRSEDGGILEEIAKKEDELARDPANPELLFHLGSLHFRVREASKAMNYFERALQIKPLDEKIKVAYADASIKRDEYEKISIRGIVEKRAVFRAVCLKDPLQNRRRFPQAFYDLYGHVQNLIEIPDTVTLSAEIIDGTVGHSMSVAVLGYALADRLGLPEDRKKAIMIAARLQDLGKRAIWHHILNRRGGISDGERKELQGHVAESISTARSLGYDQPDVLEIIGNHHELMNGEGYPKGVKGEEISLEARISGVADVYCALTSWRSFREHWDSHVALSELKTGAQEGMYDARVVDTLCELIA